MRLAALTRAMAAETEDLEVYLAAALVAIQEMVVMELVAQGLAMLALVGVAVAVHLMQFIILQQVVVVVFAFTAKAQMAQGVQPQAITEEQVAALAAAAALVELVEIQIALAELAVLVALMAAVADIHVIMDKGQLLELALFVLFGRATHVHSHQLVQVAHNGTFHPNS